MMENPERFLDSLRSDPGRTFRRDAMTSTVIKDKTVFVIDTCNSPDCEWETAIRKNPDENWKIVEEYRNKERATEGHTKWTRKCEENEDFEPVECRDPLDWFFRGEE